MVINTNDIGIFLVNVFVALVVFIGLLIFTLRGRSQRPVFRILILAFIVVVCGMSFARITYGIGVPWWIFYGLPALITFVLPPLVLRMSRRELLLYVPMAILMSPVSTFSFHFSLVGMIICHFFMCLVGMSYYKTKSKYVYFHICFYQMNMEKWGGRVIVSKERVEETFQPFIEIIHPF